MIEPKIRETICEGACGSAAFLVEAYGHMRTPEISATDFNTLQTKTFYRQEKKLLAYIFANINVILQA